VSKLQVEAFKAIRASGILSVEGVVVASTAEQDAARDLIAAAVMQILTGNAGVNDPRQVAQILTAQGIQGAVPRYPLPVSHPFGPPVVSGTSITVENMLNQPTRITRMVMDITRERFIADRIFANGGGVTGGAVVYDAATENELYTNRDVEIIAPAAEFPLVTTEQLVPNVALVEKWGGKTFITDEARDRNDTAGFTKLIRQLANTIVRKLNQRAVGTLTAALADGSRDVIGNNWSTYDPETDPPQQSPAYDVGRAQMQADNEEMGVDFNLWLINPQEALNLTAIYGPALNGADFPTFYSSPRVKPGEAYALQSGGVGQMRTEKALGTETWREPKTERTWTQSSVRPLWFVDNKFAILHFTHLAG
jgi:hypothetical protein